MIAPGTRIVCEHGHPICEVGPDGLAANTIFSADKFSNWQIEPIQPCEAFVCPCGGAIAETHSLLGFRIATDKGWRYADERLDRKVA